MNEYAVTFWMNVWTNERIQADRFRISGEGVLSFWCDDSVTGNEELVAVFAQGLWGGAAKSDVVLPKAPTEETGENKLGQ